MSISCPASDAKPRGLLKKVLCSATALALAAMLVPTGGLMGFSGEAYASTGDDLAYIDTTEKIAESANTEGVTETAEKRVILKQLMVEGDELPKGVDTISEVYEQEDYTSIVISQYSTELTTYKSDDKPGKALADLGSVSDTGAGKILDWAAIQGSDAFEPEDVADKIDIDCETGIAVMDDSLFADGNYVTLQTLVSTDMKAAASTDIDLEIVNDGTKCTATAETQQVRADTFDITTTLPIATPETAGGISLSDLTVYLNGSELPMELSDGDNAVYDTESGELTITESAATLKSVKVEIASGGWLDKLVGGGKAYAAGITNADNLAALRDCVTNEPSTLTKFDMSKAAAGQLYTYEGYYYYWEPTTASSHPVFSSAKEYSEKYCYVPSNGSSSAIKKIYSGNTFKEVSDAGDGVVKASSAAADTQYTASPFLVAPPGSSVHYQAKSTSSGGTVQSFKGFGRTNTEGSNYTQRRLLAAACSHIDSPLGTVKSGDIINHSDWAKAEATIAMKLLKVDKTKNYIVIGITTPDVWNQTGSAIYKLMVADDVKTTGIDITKTSSSAETDGNSSYSLNGAIFGIFDSQSEAQEAVTAAQSGTTEDDESFNAKAYAKEFALDYAETDSFGKGSVDGLDVQDSSGAYKTYYVVELAAPQGFKLNTEITQLTCTASNDETNHLTATVEDDPKEVSIKIVKTALQTNLTDGNPNYSLEGTTFGVYTSESDAIAGQNKVSEIVITKATDASGNEVWTGESGDLTCGTYYVRETKAGKGYVLNPLRPTFAVDATEAGKTYDLDGDQPDGSVGNNPDVDPLIIKKVDAETGSRSPQGGGSLSRAQFTIKYYKKDVNAAESAQSLAASTPDAEWLVQTDDKGEFAFDNIEGTFEIDGETLSYLIGSAYNGAPLNTSSPSLSNGFVDEQNNAIIPFGWVTIEETRAPQGYQRSSEVKAVCMKQGMSETEYTVSYGDEVVRGDMKLTKVDENGTPLANIPFRITNTATGEKHIIVTDENGVFDSKTATNTNSAAVENDSYSFAAEAAKWLTDHGTTTDSADGIWFGKTADNSATAPETAEKGAFQYGTYTIEELLSPWNWGKKLVGASNEETFAISDTDTELYVDMGQVVDLTIAIGTNATDKATGSKTVTIGHDAVIVDDVELMNLNPNTEYRIDGTLMDASTSLPITDADGNAITASATVVTGDEVEGVISEQLEFTLDTAAIDSDTSIVVFEKLYDVTNTDITDPVATHEDIEDEGQTVYLYGIHTTAEDKTDQDKTLLNSETATICDTVTYNGLKEGASYTMKASLVDEDGNEIAGAEGETEFTADRDGAVEVIIEFDATEFENGDKLTVFENLYEDGSDTPVATHCEVGDKDQTVKITVTPTIVPPKTGASTFGLTALAGLLVAAAVAAAAYGICGRRRKDEAEQTGSWNA